MAAGRTIQICRGFLLTLALCFGGAGVQAQETWPTLPEDLQILEAPASLIAARMGAQHAENVEDIETAARLYAQPYAAGIRAEAAAPYPALKTYLWTGDLTSAGRVAEQLQQAGAQDDLISFGLYFGALAADDPAMLTLVTQNAPQDQFAAALREPLLALSIFGAGQLSFDLTNRDGSPFEVAQRDLARALLAEASGDVIAAQAAFGQVVSSPIRSPQALKFAADFFWRQGQFSPAANLYTAAEAGGVFLDPNLAARLNARDASLAPDLATQTGPIAAKLIANMATILAEESSEAALFYRATLWTAAQALDAAQPAYGLEQARAFAEQEAWVSLVRTLAGTPQPAATALPSVRLLSHAYGQLGQSQAAIAVAQAALTNHPDDPRLILSLADSYLALEDYAAALPLYETATQMFDNNSNLSWLPYFRLGVVQTLLDNDAAAETAFRASLARDPNQPVTLNYLGYSLADQNRNVEEALAMIEQAVAQVPYSSAYVDSLGWAQFQLGRYDEALANLQRAVELATTIDPLGRDGIWELLDHLGDAYQAVGRVREANFHWRQALSYLPEDAKKDTRREAIEAKINGARP